MEDDTRFRSVRKRFWFLVTPFLFTVLLVALVLGGCGRQGKVPKYRIGLGPWVGYGPLYLARDKGFFKEAGLQVDLIVLTGLAERNSALRSGKLDALAAPVDYFVLSAGNGVPTTIVMATDESVGGDGIVAKKSIKTFTDLVGKRVAFQRGLPSEFFFRALLQEHHINIDEIKYVDMETAQAGAAFLAGNLDAAVLWEPWLTRAKEEGNGHILASTRDHPDLIVDCLAFNQEVVKQKPGEVQKIVSALLKAIRFAKDRPQEATAIMAPYFQVEPAKYAKILQGVDFTGVKRNREYFGTSAHPGPIFQVASRASKIWLSAKVIAKPVKPEDIITAKFVSVGGP